MRAPAFVAVGCATGWDECPHGAQAVTVTYPGHRLTSCISRDQLERELVAAIDVRSAS